MRRSIISCVFLLTLISAVSLQAQQFDGAIGFGSVKAPAGSNGVPSESGGLYISFSGNVIFKHHIGFGGEVAPRFLRAQYGVSNGSVFLGSIPYRPIFYDLNAVYGITSMKKKIGGDLMAGIGGQDTRFYVGGSCGFTGCTNYTSSNHFAWHFGADFRYYFKGHAFIRPEAHYYIVHNNVDFNNVNVSRYAVSIGYSFTPGF